MKLITLNKLNRFWTNGVVAKMVAKTKVLTTLEQVKANTNAENVANALVTKELYNNLTSQLPNSVKLITEGSGANTKYYIQLGADTASKKLLGSGIYGYMRVCVINNENLGSVGTLIPTFGKKIVLYSATIPSQSYYLNLVKWRGLNEELNPIPAAHSGMFSKGTLLSNINEVSNTSFSGTTVSSLTVKDSEKYKYLVGYIQNPNAIIDVIVTFVDP